MFRGKFQLHVKGRCSEKEIAHVPRCLIFRGPCQFNVKGVYAKGDAHVWASFIFRGLFSIACEEAVHPKDSCHLHVKGQSVSDEIACPRILNIQG